MGCWTAWWSAQASPAWLPRRLLYQTRRELLAGMPPAWSGVSGACFC